MQSIEAGAFALATHGPTADHPYIIACLSAISHDHAGAERSSYTAACLGAISHDHAGAECAPHTVPCPAHVGDALQV